MSTTWPVEDAESGFDELLDAALAEGLQVVTRRGVKTATLIPIEQWRRLERMTRLLMLSSDSRGLRRASEYSVG